MITSVIGRTFLDAFNAKYTKDYSPKEFFEKEYWELFYNHEKYMQWVTNSPFVQMKKGQKPHLLTDSERVEKLEALEEKILQMTPDASFALGYPASEVKEYASTSGLVSDLDIPVDKDEVYLSWIGSGLGIGVAGGFTILFDNVDIVLKTYEGWRSYRQFLNDPTLVKLRGNQINSWNGQWLAYTMNPTKYKEDFDFNILSQEGFFKLDANTVEMSTVPWSRLFFSLSNHYPDSEMMSHVYGFGQTNKTIGFIPFQFKSGRKIKDVYHKLFGDQSIDQSDFENLFGMHIKRACELGSIGLLALRPQQLEKYMHEGKSLSLKKEEDLITYYAYKTWLKAMLSRNKEEITDYTMELAAVIKRYRAAGSKLDRKTLIEKELFASAGKRGFIESLCKMIKDLEGADLLTIKELKDEVHLMTNEEYTYFCTLVKFDYTFLERQS
ncbi:hypothetical protein [Fulvivirga sediminis]|uniref:Uncharacterized protein n=1 Tax=Fulvivirga sediminis TaxID=2803949 RepID=A0A937F8J0_9BACT|nr:hypothetical protein [Fulvivirga sediminis]MBL3656008.1 hypothetical protein [Fulvivirga sediminis]